MPTSPTTMPFTKVRNRRPATQSVSPYDSTHPVPLGGEPYDTTQPVTLGGNSRNPRGTRINEEQPVYDSTHPVPLGGTSRGSRRPRGNEEQPTYDSPHPVAGDQRPSTGPLTTKIDPNETRELFNNGPTKTDERSDKLYETLLTRAQQDLNINPNVPAIRQIGRASCRERV